MSSFRRAAVAAVLLALVPSAVVACMWDYDTLKMERQRFPSALELITGKFLRHSPEFYEWRIRDRTARLQTDPTNLALHDDLAVAYDKTGRHDKAIETMRAADKLRPGRYETQSNLATFLFHDGRLEESLEHVEAALKINPDAHFGREKYQKYLTQYVIARRMDGKIKLPLASVTFVGDPPPAEPRGLGDVNVRDTFGEFVAAKSRPHNSPNLGPDEAAIKGVLGMMRFANYDSPVLLEALGGLLSEHEEHPKDAKRLSARAYLKASYEVNDETARRDYRLMATRARALQTRNSDSQDEMKLSELEAEFQKELEEARAWYAELHAKELGWIRDGKNADEEFDKLYDREPEVAWDDEPRIPVESRQRYLLIGLIVGGSLVALAAVWVLRSLFFAR